MTKESKKSEFTSIDNMQRLKRLICVLWIGLGFACSSDYVPKPKGYNRIEIDAPKYISLADSLPYQFEYSDKAKIFRDSSWIAERFWVDIYYPELDATIQVTYKPVKQNRQLLEEYLRDSYRLTSEHNVKAYAIDESVVQLKSGMYATLMELSGEVPTQFQFHVTDSVNHFMRCALYFKTATANDSLKPVIDYVKDDMAHLLNTLYWNDGLATTLTQSK